jgi:hypothetical protein
LDPKYIYSYFVISMKAQILIVRNVTKFKYLRATVTNKNYIHEKLRSILNSGDACWPSELFDFSSPI